MGLMQDAMAKAGLVSQEKADAVEAEKAKPVLQEDRREHRHREDSPIHTTPRPGLFQGTDGEDDSALLAKLDGLFNNDRSRKFMNHLVFAFTPFGCFKRRTFASCAANC
jgi:hypothetical protein